MNSQIKNKLEVLKYDDKNKVFTVKSSKTGNVCKLDDTFAEMFPLWVGRILITAENKKNHSLTEELLSKIISILDKLMEQENSQVELIRALLASNILKLFYINEEWTKS